MWCFGLCSDAHLWVPRRCFLHGCRRPLSTALLATTRTSALHPSSLSCWNGQVPPATSWLCLPMASRLLPHRVWVGPVPFPAPGQVLQNSRCRSGPLTFLHSACMETLFSKTRGRPCGWLFSRQCTQPLAEG